MRVLIIALTAIVVVGYLGFLASNIGTTVPIRVFQTEYPDVSIHLVVIASMLIGAIAMGIIAIAEGAGIRLENRRLRREQQKLETELNFLRTQPATARSPETGSTAAGPATASDRRKEPDRHVPTAPVYGDDEGWPDDGDDDVYSGGRAV